MSELYHHLLIPTDPDFVADLNRIAKFFGELESHGVLPHEFRVTAITLTGKTRVIGRNPKTGENYYGPELNVRRFSTVEPAIDALANEAFFDLLVDAVGPSAVPLFELYGIHRADFKWTEPFGFSVRCRQREKITHFLHSPFGCTCEVRPDDPGTFENPWNDAQIETSGLACARFWIDIGIGNYLVPMIADTLDILDPRMVSLTEETFAMRFTQGCFCNDD